MKTNSIYRIIEAARKGKVEQCLRYCSKVYDAIEKATMDAVNGKRGLITALEGRRKK